MSAYERERAEHIARNKERMAALHLPSLASSMAPKKEARPAKQRGISSKRHKAPVSKQLPSRLNLLIASASISTQLQRSSEWCFRRKVLSLRNLSASASASRQPQRSYAWCFCRNLFSCITTRGLCSPHFDKQAVSLCSVTTCLDQHHAASCQ